MILPQCLSISPKCAHQTSDVKDWAAQEHQAKYARPSNWSLTSTPLLMLPLVPPHASSSHQPMENTSPLFLPQFPPSPFHPQPGFTPQLSPAEINSQSPSLFVNAPIPTLPQSPYTNALGFSTQPPPNLSPNLPPLQPLSSLSSYPLGPSISQPQSRFSYNFDQHKFNIEVGRMTVAAGLPISWTDNPQV